MNHRCVLVVGGAGFIGSHMVKMLLANGVAPIVLDNLCGGHRDAVLGGTFVRGDVGDGALLEQLFSSYPVSAVMHFASFIQVGESVVDPARYYRNNVANTLTLLEAMRMHGVTQLVFSSTAAIFGEPLRTPIDEYHPRQPLNPYGRSKLMVEQMLADYDRAYGLKSVSLRYFNAAGADPDGELGERHEPETHLIPLCIDAAMGRRPPLSVFGQDYDTPDGTCVRDYVHVNDLCKAHLLALDDLARHNRSLSLNLGNGQGFSVAEVIATVREVTGLKVPTRLAARRTGDPARLVADSRAAKETLHWNPDYPDLRDMVNHAWRWALTGGTRRLAA